ncbi:mediator of RNA polymerase II transcription subunit 4 [Vanessa tameamea]|uniref:Mediator of RNA polymerase II transcription subunit 4 n=1 Tax=Vanessa tameamea TaxID=334116 RepID=A0A8B8HKJ5_VANTA|nr:mediator of RNA polymerase II transcription subunit 4 [Vanessa tameamea]XP_047532077.1 mediator of RNA polymerase II transcription subunit 4 [Vanessa atalanta]
MASHLSTKDRLLSLIDDMELIAKEIIEVSIAPKSQKLSAADHAQLTDLLLCKDAELKKTLDLADEQAKIQQKMNDLKAEVDNKDQDIHHLQRQLKDAEQILATSLYQARQKLASIVKSRKRPVPSEELIKFAHRISASNAVSAPLSWQPGDPRRPYPTDLEMRLGMLGRLCDLPLNGHTPSTLNELHRITTGGVPASATNQFTWHPSGELHMSVGGGNSVAIDGRSKDAPTQEDVEVMSTDSSSSSSSDSQ